MKWAKREGAYAEWVLVGESRSATVYVSVDRRADAKYWVEVYKSIRSYSCSDNMPSLNHRIDLALRDVQIDDDEQVMAVVETMLTMEGLV